jgi:putative transposase
MGESITYVGKGSSPSYLALITDAYSNKIVGDSVSYNLNMEGSRNALEMALRNRVYKDRELIHYSDQGYNIVLMNLKIDW